jgi:hypothetical protein
MGFITPIIPLTIDAPFDTDFGDDDDYEEIPEEL